MQDLFVHLGQLLGVAPEHMLSGLVFAALIFQAIGKAIPDSSTGILGLIRKIAKVLGFYVSNRVTPNATVSDVASEFAETRLR